MGELGQNTNLASEFYVLSMLYRKGIDAHLTLGNKKAVDIVIESEKRTITIDVKGLRGKTDFLMDNWEKEENNHYLVFVSYLGKINDHGISPEVFIVPSRDIMKPQPKLENQPLLYRNPKGNRRGISYKKLRKLGNKYKDRWDRLAK